MGLLSIVVTIVLLNKIAESKGFKGVSNNFLTSHHLTSCSLESRLTNRKDAIWRQSGAVHRTSVWATTSLVHCLCGSTIPSAHLQSHVLRLLPFSLVEKLHFFSSILWSTRFEDYFSNTSALHTFTCHSAQEGSLVV